MTRSAAPAVTVRSSSDMSRRSLRQLEPPPDATRRSDDETTGKNLRRWAAAGGADRDATAGIAAWAGGAAGALCSVRCGGSLPTRHHASVADRRAEPRQATMLAPTAAGPCLSSPAPPTPTTTTAPPHLIRLPPLATHHRARRCRARPPRAGRAPTPPPAPSSRPARDRVIEFGKHRGQMLGTLPPSYLQWVAAELDYGDTAPWAGLARAVLDDPVYVDRVEWEHAHRFLRGDADGYDYAYDADGGGDGPLQEMAERFGWDLSDEEGWGRLDLRLLGTSYGGRIPRKGARTKQQSNSNSNSSTGGAKKGSLFGAAAAAGADPGRAGGKRDERRERVRMRREEQVRTAKLDMLGVHAGVADGGVLGSSSARKQAQIRTASKEILGLGQGGRAGEMLDAKRTPGNGGKGANPFPGRQAFLDKVRKLKGDE